MEIQMHFELKEKPLDVGELTSSALSDKVCGSSLRIKKHEAGTHA